MNLTFFSNDISPGIKVIDTVSKKLLMFPPQHGKNFNGVVYVYFLINKGITITPTVKTLKDCYQALVCLEVKFEKKRKGSSSLYFWFCLRFKGKTVIARLQCLKGALLYTIGEKKHRILFKYTKLYILRHNLKTV